MRVLIAGAGYVGLALASELVAKKHDVTVLKRTTTNLPSGIRLHAADLTRPESLETLPKQFDAVVYTAAADSGSLESYQRAYIDGPKSLFTRVTSAGRVLFTSSTSVYAQNDGSVVNEESPTEPKDPNDQLMLQAERNILALPHPASVIRFGGIYGPGRTRLVDMVRSGTARLAKNGGGYTNRIHRDDCARVLAHVLELPALSPVYVGVDEEPVLKNDVLTWLANAVAAPTPPVGTETPPLNKRCDSTQLRHTGFAFRYPTYREGYGALL